MIEIVFIKEKKNKKKLTRNRKQKKNEKKRGGGESRMLTQTERSANVVNSTHPHS